MTWFTKNERKQQHATQLTLECDTKTSSVPEEKYTMFGLEHLLFRNFILIQPSYVKYERKERKPHHGLVHPTQRALETQLLSASTRIFTIGNYKTLVVNSPFILEV